MTLQIRKKNQLSYVPQTIENRCERLLYQTRFKTQISQTITALKPWPTFGLGDKLCWSAVNINHNNWIWQPHVPKTGIAIVLLYMISTFILLRLQTLCSKKGNKIESKMTIRTATEIILKILAMKLSRVLWSSILSVYHLKTLNLAHIHLYSHSGCSIGFKNWNGQTRAYVFFDQTIDMCVGKSKPCLNTIIHAFPMLACTDFIDMNTSKVSAMWVGLRAQFALPWRSEFLNHAGTCHLTKQMFSQWPQDMQPPDPSADQTGQGPSSRIFVDPQMKNASRQDQSGLALRSILQLPLSSHPTQPSDSGYCLQGGICLSVLAMSRKSHFCQKLPQFLAQSCPLTSTRTHCLHSVHQGPQVWPLRHPWSGSMSIPTRPLPYWKMVADANTGHLRVNRLEPI